MFGYRQQQSPIAHISMGKSHWVPDLPVLSVSVPMGSYHSLGFAVELSSLDANASVKLACLTINVGTVEWLLSYF